MQNPCVGNTATKRYVQKKNPTIEMFYLNCSDGWMQRLTGEGLLNFTDQCKVNGVRFTIVDPEKVHIRDKVV